MDTFVKHNFGLMICNFFNKVRFLTNKLKLLIFMKKPFLHLHLSLLFLMGCVFLLPSCIEDKAEDAAHRLVVSKVDVELIQTGMLNTGSKASFDVLANRGYVITSDAEWLDVDKPTGKGRVSVTLEAKPNETAGERTGHLTVTSGKLSERVTVTQTLDPDPDDGNPVGYTYYSENFDWIAVYGGADCVGLGSQNGAKKAVLSWKCLACQGNRALLEVELETGRFHQIRVQMAHAGMPLLGDQRYGSEESREVSMQLGIRTIRLQAVKLAFCHPTSGKRVCYELTDKLTL